MTKLEEKLEHLEVWNMDDEGKPMSPKFTKVLSALRKALEQRDSQLIQNTDGHAQFARFRNHLDTEILKVLGE